MKKLRKNKYFSEKGVKSARLSHKWIANVENSNFQLYGNDTFTIKEGTENV